MRQVKRTSELDERTMRVLRLIVRKGQYDFSSRTPKKKELERLKADGYIVMEQGDRYIACEPTRKGNVTVEGPVR